MCCVEGFNSKENKTISNHKGLIENWTNSKSTGHTLSRDLNRAEFTFGEGYEMWKAPPPPDKNQEIRAFCLYIIGDSFNDSYEGKYFDCKDFR